MIAGAAYREIKCQASAADDGRIVWAEMQEGHASVFLRSDGLHCEEAAMRRSGRLTECRQGMIVVGGSKNGWNGFFFSTSLSRRPWGFS